MGGRHDDFNGNGGLYGLYGGDDDDSSFRLAAYLNIVTHSDIANNQGVFLYRFYVSSYIL